MKGKYLLTILVAPLMLMSACQTSASNGPIANAPIETGGTLIEGDTSSNNPANISSTGSGSTNGSTTATDTDDLNTSS